MSRLLGTVLLAVAVSGCSLLGIEGPGHYGEARLEPGQTTVQVTERLGSPQERRADGAREAWLYCFGGTTVDEYVVAWFENDVLVGADVAEDFDWGRCTRQFDAFSWDQAPQP